MQHERELQAVLAARFLAQLIGDRTRTSSWPVTWMPTPDAASVRFWTGRHIFIGKARRIGTKPACISEEIARAWARAAAGAGHNFAAGNFSARYSRIASDSQTRTSPSASAGTFPAGETFATICLKCGSLSEITCSANGMPATIMAIHGRNDHDE